ncbi:MAG TPA: hypothetical protein VLA19_21095 [Herpetosiphonaceae bacterium]|nr:hypothetical protein [Herpetosiphonaceae bacterium]
MRLPERDPAGLAYLERRQQDDAFTYLVDISPKGDDAYLDLARALMRAGAYPPGTDEASVARTLRQSHEVPDPSRWSAYERPDHRLRLWRAEQTVARGLASLGQVLPAPLPALGTLSTWQLNARAIPVPSTGGYVIAFDSGLFSFTAGWAKVLAACLTHVQNGGLLDRFVDLCFCQIILGTAAYLDWRPMANPQLEVLSERFDPGFEAFLLGHEYAHVALGHQPVDLSVASGAEPAQGFRRDEELDADALGFEVVLKAFPDPVHTYVSVAGYFCALQLMERGYGLLQGDARAIPPGDSHPPVAERRASLFNRANALLSAEALAQAIAQVRLLEDRTLQLWLPLEPCFWHGSEGMPEGWQPRSPQEKSAALLAFKWYCLEAPASPH